jgi:hypothetical protein
VSLVSRVGEIRSLAEIPVDRSEVGAAGYVPEGCEDLGLGRSEGDRIAGGDLRLYAVRLAESRVALAPHRVPLDAGVGRLLPLRDGRPLQEQILLRPTFLQHWDGAVVDWRYLLDRDPQALRREAGWLARQHLRLLVDLTSGLNLYPDLRLIDNCADEYRRSMDVVSALLDRMEALGARTLVVALHRLPENNMERDPALASMRDALARICAQAAQQQATVLLRTTTRSGQSVADHASLVAGLGAPNLSLAVSTALLLHAGVPAAQVAPQAGLWLAGAPGYDVAGTLYTLHAPMHGSAHAGSVRDILAAAPAVPVALDAVYRTLDDEYRDARLLAPDQRHR